MIDRFEQLDLSGSYTYFDYLTWTFKERVELLRGRIFKMSPAPRMIHQAIVSALNIEIGTMLKKTNCRIFPAPFDVRLPITNEKGEPNTVVQPDLCVVCNLEKLDSKGCNGSPDIVIEIVSKSSVQYDLHEKYQLYQEAKVPEYWIVHPQDKTLTVFVLDQDSKYQPLKPLTYGDFVQSSVLPELRVDLSEVFRDVVREPEEPYGEDEGY